MHTYICTYTYIYIYIQKSILSIHETDKSDPDENLKLKSLYTHHAHDKDINTIAISPNEKIFATGSQDKTIKVWSTKDGKLVGKFLGHKRGVWSIDFSKVDQTLLSSSG